MQKEGNTQPSRPTIKVLHAGVYRMTPWLDMALELCRRGATMAEAARQIGVSRQRVHQVLSHYSRNLEYHERLTCMGLVGHCPACGEEFRRKASLQAYCCYRCRNRAEERRKSLEQGYKPNPRLYRNTHSPSCSRLDSKG